MRHHRSVIRLLGLAESQRAPRRYAELGVARGELALAVARACPGWELLLVDTWQEHGDPAYRATGDQEALAPAKHHQTSYHRVLAHFGPGGEFFSRATILRTSTAQAAWQVPDGTLGVVFIDAAHDFASVWGDIVAWTPKLAAGGILAGHDFRHRRFHGVTAAVGRAQAYFGWRIETLPGQVWFTRDASCMDCGEIARG